MVRAALMLGVAIAAPTLFETKLTPVWSDPPAIADGAMPGADGRGYVLRRILRRAVRHGRQTFGVEKPFLASIIPSVVEVLGDVFPEMKQREDQVMTVINEEEEAFRRTLDRGLELFDDAAKRTSGGRIEGEDAFRLHDTFGFPIDLTTVMAEERALQRMAP